MPVIKSHQEYFELVREFNTAPDWQRSLLIRGTLLSKCNDLEPVSIRLRLRRFWQHHAAAMGLDVGELKTWV